MSETQRILVACELGEEALARLTRQPGFSVEVAGLVEPADLSGRVRGFDAAIVPSAAEVGEAVGAGPELKVVGCLAAGVSAVDVAAATRQGVAVVDATAGDVVAAAEFAIALLLSLARKIPQAAGATGAGGWEPRRFLGREVRGKTLGIVGLGRVGGTVAELAQGLRMRVLAYDPHLAPERAGRVGASVVTWDALLRESDFLSVHAPLTPETRGLLGDDALARLKPGALLVNCAAGGIVDEAALVRALEAGRLAGAALDAFEVEPPPRGALHGRDDVLLTPRLAAATGEARAQVAVEVADAVAAYLTTGTTPNLVNAPAASAEAYASLRPLLALAEFLGLFLAQASEGPVESAAVTCRGGSVPQGADLVTASFLVGLLGPSLSGRVNAVNAVAAARERGLRISTGVEPEARDFGDLVSCEVAGPWGRHLAEGTLFGRREPRLVRLDAFRLHAAPAGTMLLLYNDDVPGVIGAVGACLGRHGVNISAMSNSREEPGGRAVTLVGIDGDAPAAVLEDLARLPRVRGVRPIRL